MFEQEKSTKRIYVVGTIDEKFPESFGSPRLVRAASQAQAIGHVVKKTYHAAVAKPDDLVRLVEAVKKVEETT